MIKRRNKITSLLVAAAAVVSLVPEGVSAAEIKTIDVHEGTIESAASFNNGAYYIDGDIDGKGEAVYYVSPDGKYNELLSGSNNKNNQIEQGSIASNFASKYARVLSNDLYTADYTVDMTNGTVTDTDAKQDMLDAVGKALKSKIKDATDRYDKSDKILKKYDDHNISRRPGNYFMTTYATSDNEKKYAQIDSKGNYYFNVYCDINGNYIDGDYNLGKIKVETTTAGAATISNTEDSKDIKDGKVSASLSNIVNIDHDQNNVYRWATITVMSDSPIKAINGVEIIDKNKDIKTAFTDVKGDQTEISYNVIQKLSKAAAPNEINGAKYPQTVINYVLADKHGNAVDGIDGKGKMITGNYFIMDGKISIYALNSDCTQVTIRPYEFSSDGNWNYLDEGNIDTEDCEEADDSTLGTVGAVAASGGVLYRVSDGYVYSYDNNGGWNKTYKIDSSLNEFTVENVGNMILWNKDKEIYSVISTKPTVASTATTTAAASVTTATVATAGWVQAIDGTWNYNKADGTKATDWINDKGTWYYLNELGVMKTGWISDEGSWYYLNESGAMLENTTVDGYVLDATGAWIK
ncbi:cell wall binding repeat-containing protein [Clostridium sp. DL-VIII]|uniref:N-acetylmuramoyl-L-alanine amidase family protein n=1 Tax=Clostridium sp. DL-VIII TaxID=641107 RepID=UPI00023B028A|nr:cell wall-binding repeat-containing protein [Clostridium sp. DL-VIII]EHJ01753.1 cell wall binding repeat-containing protein [Clostridium sp. DL-VIII]